MVRGNLARSFAIAALLTVPLPACGRLLFDWDLQGPAADASTDASSTRDGNLSDAQLPDATVGDADVNDARMADANTPDANALDARSLNDATIDARIADANSTDAVITDAVITDAGVDATPFDAGCTGSCSCVRYVDLSATGAADGLSWATAFRSLQPGIDSAEAALTGMPMGARCEVWVAAGRYFTFVSAVTDTIGMRARVDLYGGFAGNETDRADRDPMANITILDGRNSAMSQRVYHVVTGAGPARIDGFKISDGAATTTGLDGKGGGLISTGAVPPVIANCEFADNTASTGNGGRGGGVAVVGAALPLLVLNTTFLNNGGHTGAALSVEGASANLVNCTFTNNVAQGLGGAIATLGARITVVRGRFAGNQSNGNGGAILLAGGATDSARVDNSDFRGNVSGASGGAIALVAGSIELSNNTLVSNTAGGVGGAIWLSGVQQADITNQTIALNTSGGGGMGLSADCQAFVCGVRNSIFWNPGSNVELSLSGMTLVSHSIVRGGTAGTAILNADPLLTNPPSNVMPTATSPALDAADGCRAPATDINGFGRVDVTAVPNTGVGPPADIGALERQSGGTPAPWSTALCCDAPIARPGGGQIVFCPSDTSWQRARDTCEAAGGQLATIHSLPVQNAFGAATTRDAWIGLFREPNTTLFRWVDGTTVDFDAWPNTQPSGAGECTVMTAADEWFDMPCTRSFGALCETP